MNSAATTATATDAAYLKCVLCFAVIERRILLIRKLRGLGQGKINGPGGKIDPGETPMAAAIRETEEEIGVTPTGLHKAGELWFDFVDGTEPAKLHCVVYRADGIVGEPKETAEAIPLWFPLNGVPYHEMWADDIFWIPLLIEGDRFEGRFKFDGEKMIEHKIRVSRRPVALEEPVFDECGGCQ